MNKTDQVISALTADFVFNGIGIMKLTREGAQRIVELLKEQQAEIERLNVLLKEQQQKWIPADERPPEENEDVLVCVNGTYRDMAYRDEGRWYDERHHILRNITHWMPLPEPPKDGGQVKMEG